ncbi:hypothetical protein Mgra_00006509 [Meloidogyne graminicola]|uniref:Uncharacterized protein n=1 Tax=Meloidogyne graminicola TaxID=189291 RepID=A0A8S9ZL53_9BILA|nr:hypothetical protein Mgra_00006509 [Meloidogyne graminicola]
MQLMASIW